MTIITDPRCTEYRSVGHPEKPTRVLRTVELLKRQQALELSWAEPADVDDAILLRAHPQAHLDRLLVQEDFDGDTAWHPGIDQHARRGVGGAIKAVELARKGDFPFSLLRPPGHHAMRDHAMGFCYLSSMAIATLHALATGSKQVAVLDFDVHHGNGTEDILKGKPGTTFCSIHQYPCYPGSGTSDVGGNCFNFPVAPRTPREEYRKVIERAFDRIRAAKPDMIGVSAGFDAYAKDPLAQETLEREDFQWIGTELRKFGVPVFSILEGGYSPDLPELILAYLLGLAGK
jgi:acetoin utilization deacetylase AcuC-like enzyme